MAKQRAIFGKRSQRSVLWALGLFAIGQIAAGLALDYAFPLTRFPSAAGTLERAAAEPQSPDVVFLGSSRTMTGVVAAEANRLFAERAAGGPAPRVLNAGVIAGDALSAEFVFDRLGTKPKWIVLEISPETLNDRPPFMREHAVRQLTWRHLFTDLPAMLRASAAWTYVEGRLFPVYTHRRQLVAETKSLVRGWLPAHEMKAPAPVVTAPQAPGPIPTPGAGSEPAFVTPPTGGNAEELLLKQSRIGAETIVRRWLRDYRIAGLTPQALERILTRCRADGIQVILLGMPACSAHRREYTPAIMSTYRDYIDRLQREYGCRFVDASDWVPDLQFGDTLHIRSETGGMAFTARFTREVLFPLLP